MVWPFMNIKEQKGTDHRKLGRVLGGYVDVKAF